MRIPLLKVSGLKAEEAESHFNYIVSFQSFKALPPVRGNVVLTFVWHVFSLGPLLDLLL